MKQVFEPARPSTRKVEIIVSSPSGEQVTWVARQARVQQTDGKRTLLVVQEPEDTKGNALLIWEREGQPNTMWWYPPALRRVRALVPVEAYQRFFDSDLTYADLGYVERQGIYRWLAEEEQNSLRTYKVELTPDQKVFYSRIITWIATDSLLPVQRDYYDVAGRLWKTMTFDQVRTIDGIPTPLHIRMHDVQQDSNTDVTFSEVHYGADLPEALFDSEHLPQTVESRWWQPSTAQVAPER
jgi:outer membrane lipoprotein-sorting protein